MLDLFKVNKFFKKREKNVTLTVMKMGSSNKSEGVSKKFRKKVCGGK